MDLLTPDSLQYALHVAMGLCLAATCGLRTFLPLLALNLLALTGNVELNDSYQFVGTWPATVVFGTATVAEFLADKIPGLDHLLDGVGLLAKPTAATILTAATLIHVDPLLAGVLGLVAGGASASVLGLLKAKVRAISSLSTAGVGNVVLSFGEDGLALGTVLIAVLLPGLALAVVLLMAFLMARRIRRWRRSA